MNPSIDFSKYSQIQTEPESKLRNITKHKFAISYIIFSIIIIILLIVISNRNSKIGIKEEELSKVEKNLNEIKSNVNNLYQKISRVEKIKTNLLNNFTNTNNEITHMQSEYDYIKNNNFQLLYNKNDLQAHKEFINNKKEYIEKCLKEEYLKSEILNQNFLFQKISQRLNNLSINNSNIITNLEEFKSLTKTEISDKCYDSIVYDINIKKFHDNCDGYPLLILIKTKTDEKIGAFTSITNEGIKKIKDHKSVLINFNKNVFFLNNIKNKDCYVYSHFDEFPKFGNDLIIYRDGKGEIIGNNCYKNNENINEYLLDEKKFEIDIMEVYKLKL